MDQPVAEPDNIGRQEADMASKKNKKKPTEAQIKKAEAAKAAKQEERAAAKQAKADAQLKERAIDGARLAAVLATARPAVTPCLCGCGGSTKGRFVPGHDALLKRALDATVKLGGDDARIATSAIAAFGW